MRNQSIHLHSQAQRAAVDAAIATRRPDLAYLSKRLANIERLRAMATAGGSVNELAAIMLDILEG